MTDSKTPNSPQAERILLACCIREDNKLEEAITIVNDDDFYYENNKIIFSSIKKIYNDNKPVDELSLVEELKSKNLLEEIGGVSYIYSVLESCETNMQSKSSAIIIKENSNKREIIRTSRLAIEAIEEGNDYQTVLGNIEKSLDSLDSGEIQNTKLGANVDTFLRSLKAMQDGTYISHKTPTGISHLDDKLPEGGLGRGEVMVISAPTSCGKSQLALNFALRTALVENKGVAIFSFEMPADQIMKRMTQISSGKNINHSNTKLNKDQDFTELMEATEKLCNSNIHIINYVKNITELKARSRQLKRKHNIEYIVIDYLQLIPWDRKMSKCDGIAEVSHGIKQMAMELNVPVVLLAQINREGAKSGKPNIYSLKDSGDVENDADIILMMYPKNGDIEMSKKLDKNGQPYVELEYKLVKNREGERDTSGIFVFDHYVGRFL
jgi:replicative DNA helicase